MIEYTERTLRQFHLLTCLSWELNAIIYPEKKFDRAKPVQLSLRKRASSLFIVISLLTRQSYWGRKMQCRCFPHGHEESELKRSGWSFTWMCCNYHQRAKTKSSYQTRWGPSQQDWEPKSFKLFADLKGNQVKSFAFICTNKVNLFV